MNLAKKANHGSRPNASVSEDLRHIKPTVFGASQTTIGYIEKQPRLEDKRKHIEQLWTNVHDKAQEILNNNPQMLWRINLLVEHEFGTEDILSQFPRGFVDGTPTPYNRRWLCHTTYNYQTRNKKVKDFWFRQQSE